MILIAHIAFTGLDYYVGTDAFTSGASDTPANTFFKPRLTGSVEYALRGECHLFGGLRGGTGTGTLEIINTDGDASALADHDGESGAVTLWTVDGSTMTQVGLAAVHRVETRGEDIIRIVLADPAARLDEPVQRDSYDSAAVPNNTSLVARQKPVLLGMAKSIPAHAVDPTTLQYRVNELSASIVQVLDRGTGVGFTDNGDGTLTLSASPNGMVTAEASAGGTTVAPELITNGTFDTDLTGWSASYVGTNEYFQWVSSYGGCARVSGYGYGYAGGTQYIQLEAGVTYTIQLRCHSITSGSTYRVRINGDTVASGETATGLRTYTYTASSTGGHWLYIYHDRPNINAWYYFYFDDVSVKGPDVISDQYPDDLLTDLLTDHAPSNAVSWSSADANALPAYNCGLWFDDGTTYRDVIRKLAASFGCLWYFDSTGTLRLKPLTSPVAGGLALNSNNITGDIERWRDTRDGLTARMGVARNHYVYDRANLAGVLSDEQADKLSGQWQAIVQATTTATGGSDYLGRDPLDSLLIDSADAQTEIDRQVSLYNTTGSGWRYFYRVRALGIDPSAIEPGDSVNVTDNSLGLENGRDLLVVSVTGKYADPEIELILWG